MADVQKARKEIAIANIDVDYPKLLNGARECTKNKPMNLLLANEGRWVHPEDMVHETEYESDYSIEYKCHCCGHVFRCEMPE